MTTTTDNAGGATNQLDPEPQHQLVEAPTKAGAERGSQLRKAK